MKKNLFIFFVIVLYSQGLMIMVGVPPIVIDAILLLLPIHILSIAKTEIKIAPGFILVVLYVLWSIIAAHYNDENILRALLFSRYLVMGYFVFLAIYNSFFNENEIIIIIKAIFIMFFIQIIASLYKIIFFGQSESIVGIMFNGGGGPATTFPMFAFAFMFAFFLYKEKFKYFIAGTLFFIVGYASGKLAIYFFIPLIAIIGIIIFSKFEKKPMFNKKMLAPALGLCGILIGITLILPYADQRTQRFDWSRLNLIDRVVFFVEFSQLAEAGKLGEPYSGSRSETSRRVIDETFKSPPNVFLFGKGFKSYEAIGHKIGQGAFEEYGIVYGITGWTYDALIYGWPIMIFHVGFFITLLYKINTIRKFFVIKPFWKIYILAITLNFFTFFINYFFYNVNYTIGGWMICIHLYFAALILAPQYRNMVAVSEYDQVKNLN